MSLSAIVYTSATGYTARYARMLSEDTGLPLFALGGPAGPEKGAEVLYLGWLCAGSIKGLKKARRRWAVRGICAVGMAPAQAELTAKLRRENGADALPFFYLRGGYAPEKLTGACKLLMVPMGKMISKAPAEDQEAREMRDSFALGGDWVSRAQLEPVRAWLAGEG